MIKLKNKRALFHRTVMLYATKGPVYMVMILESAITFFSWIVLISGAIFFLIKESSSYYMKMI